MRSRWFDNVSAVSFPLLVSFGAAGVGLFSSFLLSRAVSPAEYGDFVSFFSLAALLAVVFSFGYSAYFLADATTFWQLRSELRFWPVAIFVSCSVAFLATSPTVRSVALVTLVLLGIAVNGVIVEKQLLNSTLMLSVLQALPAVVKAGAVFIFLGFLHIRSELADRSSTTLYGLVCCLSAVATFALTYQWIGLPKSVTGILLSFKVIFALRGGIYFAWGSAVISISSIMALPIAIDGMVGRDVAGYFGIHLLFVAVGSTCTTVAILNRILPRFAAFHRARQGIAVTEVLRKSFFLALGLGLAGAFVQLLVALFFTDLLWPRFDALRPFLLLLAPCTFVKALQVHFGLYSTFGQLLAKKLILQVIALLTCLVVLRFGYQVFFDRFIFVAVVVLWYEILVCFGYISLAKKYVVPA